VLNEKWHAIERLGQCPVENLPEMDDMVSFPVELFRSIICSSELNEADHDTASIEEKITSTKTQAAADTLK